jgi:hypothetical protein
MSQPFSGIPDPGFPRRSRRRFQPGLVQEALRTALRGAQDTIRGASRKAQRYSEDLWLRGKRNPRTFALIGGAVALTLVGAYSLSAAGGERSACTSAGQGSSASKARKGRSESRFLLLVDQVPHAAVGSELDIYYDVCGLASGTPYRGQVRLTRQQRPAGKKRSAKPKPVVVTFQDQVDGPATRRRQQLKLGSARPGAYSLELSVVDNQGRERKRAQKLVVKAR